MKTAIVTGGCGILGWEFSKALHSAGWKVFILDVTESKKLPKGMKYIFASVRTKKDLEYALSITGPPDLVINCAAIDVPPREKQNGLFDTSDDLIDYFSIMDVNVLGTVLSCQVFGKAMTGGSIINIGSIYGEVSPDHRIYKPGFRKPIAYCVSKACIAEISRYFAVYFAPKVRVNTLTFGGVFNGQDNEFVRKYSEKVPLKRMANRKEYVDAVMFLANCTYINGSNVVVDGGYLAW